MKLFLLYLFPSNIHLQCTCIALKCLITNKGVGERVDDSSLVKVLRALISDSCSLQHLHGKGEEKQHMSMHAAECLKFEAFVKVLFVLPVGDFCQVE